jgi:gliding motility-associated-like protein
MKLNKNCFLLLLAGLFFQGFSNFSSKKTIPANRKVRVTLDCPVINMSAMTIHNPDCNQSNGSITGITVTSSGTKKTYTWLDFDGGVVGHTIDLINIPAGTYTLEVNDNSGCGSSVFSSKIFVANANVITIDDSGDAIINESCNGNGAITGIIVNGASTIEWHNTGTGKTVSTSASSADLINVPAGTYQLYAFNSTCQLTGKTYTVSQQFQVPKIIDSKIVEPTCGGPGSITLSLNVQPGQPQLNFYLVDEQGNEVKNGVIFGNNLNPVIPITGVYGGTYSFIVKNNKGCGATLGTYTLDQGNIVISNTLSTVVNDRCNQHLGFVIPVYTGSSQNGKNGIPQFFWTDLATKQVISQHKVLADVGAGTYELKIIDAFLCIGVDTFTVVNVSPSLVPPKAAGTTLCLPGMINITVTNADTAGTFKLYSSATDTTALAENATGVFYRQISKTTDFYLTRHHADCESVRTKVTETVVAEIDIPNAFTPNNDGINDNWNLAGIEKFPGAYVSVFTRAGQLVFHSTNYPTAFNGNYGGSQLPGGVYYYVIDVKQPICFGKISGSLTIIR